MAETKKYLVKTGKSREVAPMPERAPESISLKAERVIHRIYEIAEFNTSRTKAAEMLVKLLVAEFTAIMSKIMRVKGSNLDFLDRFWRELHNVAGVTAEHYKKVYVRSELDGEVLPDPPLLLGAYARVESVVRWFLELDEFAFTND